MSDGRGDDGSTGEGASGPTDGRGDEPSDKKGDRPTDERSDGPADGDDGPTDEKGDDADRLTYADAGVDIEASEAATEALVDAAERTHDATGGAGEATREADDAAANGDYAGLVPLGDGYLGLATDGVGTKLLVAEALGDYSTVGIDCVAMNVNDLVAAGVEPVAFVDYLAVEEPDEDVAEQVGAGLAAGAELAGVRLVGGETAVVPEVVTGLDLAGTAAGVAPAGGILDGTAAPGDALVGWPSSGIHSNGLTLARRAVTREHEYTDPFPPDPDRSIGEALLEPTRVYADLLAHLREHDVRAAAHVTGGGWTNLRRMGEFRYAVTDPPAAQPVFGFVKECGNVTDAEMHRTFNVGTGFVAALAPEDARALADATDGQVVGRVEEGSGVAIRGLEL